MIIRRSKINSLIKLRELKNLRELHPEMNKSAGWLLEHADNLINVRQELIVNDSFTSEEYSNTNRYIDLLTDIKSSPSVINFDFVSLYPSKMTMHFPSKQSRRKKKINKIFSL